MSANNPLDQLTTSLTAFNSFAELVNSNDGYRPTILPRDIRHVALADAFDAVMVERNSTRRAWRGIDSAQVSVTLTRRQVNALVDYLGQNIDAILEGWGEEISDALEVLEKA